MLNFLKDINQIRIRGVSYILLTRFVVEILIENNSHYNSLAFDEYNLNLLIIRSIVKLFQFDEKKFVEQKMRYISENPHTVLYL